MPLWACIYPEICGQLQNSQDITKANTGNIEKVAVPVKSHRDSLFFDGKNMAVTQSPQIKI